MRQWQHKSSTNTYLPELRCIVQNGREMGEIRLFRQTIFCGFPKQHPSFTYIIANDALWSNVICLKILREEVSNSPNDGSEINENRSNVHCQYHQLVAEAFGQEKSPLPKRWDFSLIASPYQILSSPATMSQPPWRPRVLLLHKKLVRIAQKCTFSQNDSNGNEFKF